MAERPAVVLKFKPYGDRNRPMHTVVSVLWSSDGKIIEQSRSSRAEEAAEKE